MKWLAICMAMGAAVAYSGDHARAENGSALQPGRYEVKVRLELPNLDTSAATKITRICIGAPDASADQGLVVLSDNNPLAKCPSNNVRAGPTEITFDIVCPGGNAARGQARYAIGLGRFTGRITMKMGGKNMTMTETQSGRRIGECNTPPSQPRHDDPRS